MFSEQKSENFNGGKMRSENMFKIDFNNNNNNNNKNKNNNDNNNNNNNNNNNFINTLLF